MSWIFRTTEVVPYAHNVILESCTGRLYAAFQAGNTEGGSMYLSIAWSLDATTWSHPQIVVQSFNDRSAWGPVLKCDDRGVLHLFYAMSKAKVEDFSNPGGDLYRKTLSDGVWSDGRLICNQSSWGNDDPLYFVNQLVTLEDGSWLIPFGSTSQGYPASSGAAGESARGAKR